MVVKYRLSNVNVFVFVFVNKNLRAVGTTMRVNKKIKRLYGIVMTVKFKDHQMSL